MGIAEQPGAPRPPLFRLRVDRCAWCGAYPCACRAVIQAPCACGATLSAYDDIESKRQAAERHVHTAVHRAWRDGR